MENEVVISGVRAPDLDPRLTETEMMERRPERVLLGKRPAETVLTGQEEPSKR